MEDPNTVEPTPTYASSAEPTPTDEEETVESDIPVTPPADAQQVFVEQKEVPPSPSPIEVVTDEYEEVTAPATPASTPSPSSVKADPAEEELLAAVSVAQESAAPGYTSSVDPQPTDVKVNVEEAMAEPSGPARNAEEDVAEHIANTFVRRIKLLEKMQAEAGGRRLWALAQRPYLHELLDGESGQLSASAEGGQGAQDTVGTGWHTSEEAQ